MTTTRKLIESSLFPKQPTLLSEDMVGELQRLGFDFDDDSDSTALTKDCGKGGSVTVDPSTRKIYVRKGGKTTETPLERDVLSCVKRALAQCE